MPPDFSPLSDPPSAADTATDVVFPITRPPCAFISHSAHVGLPRDVCNALDEALGGHGYKVLLDWKLLPKLAGDKYPEIINRWIFTCDVAVIVISRESLKSPWLEAEIHKVCARKDIDRSFQLIVLGLGDIDPNKVKKRLVETTAINEREWVFANTVDLAVKAVMDCVPEVAKFETFGEPLLGHLDTLKEYLGDPSPEKLRRILADHQISLEEWVPQKYIFEYFMIKLCRQSMETAGSMLDRLNLPANVCKDILEWLVMREIDLGIVEGIPRLAAREATPHVFSVSTQMRNVVAWHVRRAFATREGKGWRLGMPPSTQAPDVATDVALMVRDALASSLGLADMEWDDGELEAAIIEELQDTSNEPTIVCLPLRSEDVLSSLSQLARKYSTVTFCISGPVDRSSCAISIEVTDERGRALRRLYGRAQRQISNLKS